MPEGRPPGCSGRQQGRGLLHEGGGGAPAASAGGDAHRRQTTFLRTRPGCLVRHPPLQVTFSRTPLDCLVPQRNKGPKTTLERLREGERQLDKALGRSYERFRSGEITAQEMHRERDRLVGAFNRQVMGENIRYRSLLRQR